MNSNFIRTIQLTIVCATVLLGLLIWKSHSGNQTAPNRNEKAISASAGEPNARNTFSSEDAIREVLKQNQKLEEALSFDTNAAFSDSTMDNMATAFRSFVSKAKAINTDQCPRNFAVAYNNYLAASDVLADALAAHPHLPESATEGFLEGAIKGLNGDTSGGVDEVKAWMKDSTDKSTQTKSAKAELEAIAIGYGVRP